MKLSIIIPTWNGGEILDRHLDEVAAQAKDVAGGAEVLIVDDRTRRDGDRTTEVCRRVGDPVRLLMQSTRRGFAGTCNAGAEEARGDYLLFLNNDMHPEPRCFATLVDELDARPESFAISPVVINVAQGFQESETCLKFTRGAFDIEFPGRSGSPALEPGQVRTIDYACGGAMICRRDAYAQLGGFPEMHAPFYWEDADLGWRARRGGWSIEEVGSARVLHDHMATIGAHYSPRQVRTIFERNRLLFTWTHLQGTRWLSHLLWLAPRTLKRLLTRFDLPLLGALARVGAVRASRAALKAPPEVLRPYSSE